MHLQFLAILYYFAFYSSLSDKKTEMAAFPKFMKYPKKKTKIQIIRLKSNNLCLPIPIVGTSNLDFQNVLIGW